MSTPAQKRKQNWMVKNRTPGMSDAEAAELYSQHFRDLGAKGGSARVSKGRNKQIKAL